MLNIGRRDLPPNTYNKEPEKPVVKPQQASTPISSSNPQQFPSSPKPVTQSPAPVNLAPAVQPPEAPRKETESATPAIGPDTPGSKLWVGPKIKLKGVEISDCDVLVVEGEVEATVNSKAMQIAQPGTLKGHVTIDVAEIYGDFSGELTARAKLIVHGTGRVSGTIRYGKLIVAEGGVLSGDVQRLEGSAENTATRSPAGETQTALTSRPLR